MMNEDHLQKQARRVRYHILTVSTHAGLGHPTSSLSTTELMTALLFGGVFRFDDEHRFDMKRRLSMAGEVRAMAAPLL